MDLGFALPSSVDAAPLPSLDLAASVPSLDLAASVPSLDLAALMTALTERQAAAIDLGNAAGGEPADEPLLAPRGGAFSAAMAARLADWRGE